MKNLILTVLTLFIINDFLSQIITINYDTVIVYYQEGESGFYEMKEKFKNSNFVLVNKQKKVIDLDSMTIKYYENGEFVDLNEIFSYTKNSDGSLLIKSLESDLRNGEDLFTYQYFNEKESYYFWYWDGYENSTYLLKEVVNDYIIKK
jgi:hypothetical protein